jgi:hypothetical protein
MKKDNHDLYGPDGPEVEPTLLLRFLIKRYDELLETANPRMSLVFQGLSLAGVAHDEKGYEELSSILFPASQVQRCNEILKETLARTKPGQSPPQSGNNRGLPSLDERAYRQFLMSALREGKRMIAEKNYEFAKVLGSLGWIALQCYPRRLAEFQAAWDSFEEDPATAIENVVDVLRTAFSLKDRE